MTFRIQRTLTIAGLVALLWAFFMAGGTASAASAFSSNIASLQKTCAVLAIHMNGTQYTTTCLQARSKNSSRMTPDIGRSNDCSQDQMVIYNYDYTGVLCFYGSGYSGVAIYSVDEVDNFSGGWEWFRFYTNAGGYFCSLYSGYYRYFPSEVSVTQIDIGSYNGGVCQ